MLITLNQAIDSASRKHHKETIAHEHQDLRAGAFHTKPWFHTMIKIAHPQQGLWTWTWGLYGHQNRRAALPGAWRRAGLLKLTRARLPQKAHATYTCRHDTMRANVEADPRCSRQLTQFSLTREGNFWSSGIFILSALKLFESFTWWHHPFLKHLWLENK